MRQRRRCTQLSPVFKQSSHPLALGVTSRIWSRWLQCRAICFRSPSLMLCHLWTDHAEAFHPCPVLMTRFILLGAGPGKDVLGQRSRFDLRQVDAVEEVFCPLPDPNCKGNLRGSQALERWPEILPFQVDDCLIPVRRVLEVRALCPKAKMIAECLVRTSA